MNIVNFSQHKFHPKLNVVTIDGEQVNGLWIETDKEIKISFYTDHDIYDYYGKLLKDNKWSRDQEYIIQEYVYTNYKEDNISSQVGWSTKNQSWIEWTIKK